VAFFVWTKALSVGHPLMDGQHRRIIDMLNAFSDRFEAAVAFDAIMEMFDYAATHFCDEERLMEHAGFPDLDRQKIEHQAFLAKAVEFSRQDTSDPTLHIRLAAFLVKWLKNHIELEDMRYKPYVSGLTDTPSV
jgi:hemerythrin-like metal-binding protein